MHLSRFSDYALRVLMYAALKGGDRFQIDEVSDAYGISRNHLAKVVHKLSKLGYLDTRRGRGGGISLARCPGEIRLGRLVRETESSSVLVECFDPATNTCTISSSCRLKHFLSDAMSAFLESLDQHTLEDLVTGAHRGKMRDVLMP